MNLSPRQIFEASNGAATSELYRNLEALGPAGVIAMNLFRACKCSGRAKVYRGRGYRAMAYERKNFSLFNLCEMLHEHAQALGMEWGWAEDAAQPVHRWVLYVEIPTGQVSFHAEKRMHKKDYPREWDGNRDSPSRIVKWTTQLLNGERHDTPPRTQHPEPMPALQSRKLDKVTTGGEPTTRRLEMLELWEVALRARDD